jgi:hypothetical protein
MRAWLPVLVALALAALTGCGNSELSPAEYVERYGVDEAVRAGACVDAQPESDRASTGADVVDCHSEAAYARVIARDPERCGVGYVSGTGEPISPAIVEGETVCIEQRHLDAQQVIQGLPGSPRYRCLKRARSAGQEMRCYQEPGLDLACIAKARCHAFHS